MTLEAVSELAQLQKANSDLRVRCDKLEAREWKWMAALVLTGAALAGFVGQSLRGYLSGS